MDIGCQWRSFWGPRKTKERNRSSRERRYHCLNFEMMPWTTFSVLCLLPATTSSRVRLRHDSESRHSIAEAFDFVECCLFFNHTLFRGNRVSKASSNDFNAFSSPNFPPLVNGEYRNFECRRVHYGWSFSAVGIDIVVNWNEVTRQTSLRRFSAHKRM